MRSIRMLIISFACISILYASDPYNPEWESLAKHNEAPEWFMDAKLGIYFHWGVYTVPEFGSEWYPRIMHQEGTAIHAHHVATYGDPSVFGYHNFVSRFKAEHFDADAWADLFKKAGARFAGPVAEHHDGFSMWASKVNPWNAKDLGPQRDIVGEMAKAVRKRGMKFITTFHHAFNNQFPIPDHPTGYYPRIEGWPTASDDPELRVLYGNLPRDEFLRRWKGKLFEVIDNYQPDLIWFDFVLGDIPEKERMEFLAHYFNQALRWKKDVVVTFKQDDLPRSVAVEDFEKGRLDHLTDYPWLTDDTISWGSWCYTDNLEIKSTETVLHTLIDIVSKNGVLLLNISPRADGMIPADQREVLLGLGEWLWVNGEAIYDTRPWLTYGEGPTSMRRSGAFVGRIDYTEKDIRFTRSKDQKTIYAVVLGKPDPDITIESFLVKGTNNPSVELLGCPGNIPFEINTEKQLVLHPGTKGMAEAPFSYATVFRLSGFTMGLNPAGVFASPETIRLLPDKATLEGRRIAVKGPDDLRNIGSWDRPEERIHWLVYIHQPGVYRMRGRFTAASDESSLAVQVNGQEQSVSIPKTNDWSDVQTLDMGTFSFDKPGVYRLILQPEDAETWHPVDVFGIRMARITE